MEILIVRPEIAIDQFLPIFVESTLVLVFGIGYAAIITLAKMGYFSKKWMYVGYLFWALQTYFLYDFAVLIQSNHFTIKVLMVTMIAYFFIPHLYYYLISAGDDRYDPDDGVTEEKQ
ncbi:MAG TPA: hypothetical protein EYP60_02215 [bacterium (Candidatus Stahlbacteria)]|nr:hypothetical protein [Candidatus Stahlbacteria bacterium]